MIRLRLQRKGRRNRAYYHLVAADQRSPRDGRIIERLGRFDNVSENKELILDEERVIHWLRVGAQPTDTVRSLLKKEGILYKMHLIRWGKSDEEIEQALAEWKESRTESESEKEASRKERQKALLEAEEKEYKKQLEEKAAEAARKAKAKKAEAEQAEAAAQKESEPAHEADDPAEQAQEAADVTEEKTASESVPAEDEVQEAQAETAEPEKEESVQAEAEESQEEDEARTEGRAEESPGKVSTDMTANEAIDHVKNTSLEDLKGFVPDDEERVTVQRAWKNKQSE